MTPSPARPATPRAVPLPLLVAVAVTVVEGVVLVGNGLALLTAVSGERPVVGLGAAVFFVGYGGFLGFCAWRVYLRESWARSPIVMAQLIQILVGAGFWGGATTWVAATLVLSAVVVLAGVFHRASLEALAD